MGCDCINSCSLSFYSLFYRMRRSRIDSDQYNTGAPVAQWVKRWPTDQADRVRSPLEAKSSQP